MQLSVYVWKLLSRNDELADENAIWLMKSQGQKLTLFVKLLLSGYKLAPKRAAQFFTAQEKQFKGHFPILIHSAGVGGRDIFK